MGEYLARLGEDWVGVVAEQERRPRRQRSAHLTSPTVPEQVLARLEMEPVPTRPAPYTPLSQPITSQQAAGKRPVLELVVSGKAA